MSYGLVDDKLHGHKKAAKAKAEAMGLWVLALSWCKDHRTNGFVPTERPLLLLEDEDDPEAAATRCVDRLVKARLWEPVEGGWVFHDWMDHQRSSAEDDARQAERAARISEARAEAGRRGGLAKAANASEAKQTEASPSNGQQTVANGSKASSESEPKSDPKSEIPPYPPVGGGGRDRFFEACESRPSEPGILESPAADTGTSSPRRAPKRTGPPESQRGYATAFANGIHDAAPDATWDPPLPSAFGAPFGRALATHAPGLAGEPLQAWIRDIVAEWRRTAEPRYQHGWSVRAFLTWLNAGRPRAGPTNGHARTPNVQPVPASGRLWRSLPEQ